MPGTVSRTRAHAIVIGGSIAGLLASRALADHYAHVTVLERDVLPHGPEQRRGVPQGRHTHGLLASGLATLEHFFPGFTDELVTSGAVTGDIVRDVRWHFEGAPLARPTSGLSALMATRPLVESAVRGRVRAHPNIALVSGAHVENLTSDAGGRVTGVRLATGETLAAELVVDASGRGSRTPEWLRAMGCAAPDEERVAVGLGYTTRFFRREAAHLNGDLGSVVPPTPLGKRGGVMVAQERNLWTVTLISHFIPHAPLALDGFIAFAATLPSRDIHEVVSTAEPVGDAMSARFPASVRRRYERLTTFPEGLVVTGDGLCSFNPIYGQGMSVAALEARALHDAVAAGDAAIGRRFFRAAARLVDIPWTTAVSNDLRIPEVDAPRPLAVRVANAYVEALHRAAHSDPELATAFLRVSNLLDAPSTLMSPRLAWRVARTTFGRPIGRVTASPNGAQWSPSSITASSRR